MMDGATFVLFFLVGWCLGMLALVKWLERREQRRRREETRYPGHVPPRPMPPPAPQGICPPIGSRIPVGPVRSAVPSNPPASVQRRTGPEAHARPPAISLGIKDGRVIEASVFDRASGRLEPLVGSSWPVIEGQADDCRAPAPSYSSGGGGDYGGGGASSSWTSSDSGSSDSGSSSGSD